MATLLLLSCYCQLQVPTGNLAKLIKLGDKGVAGEEERRAWLGIARAQSLYYILLPQNPH